MRIPVVLVLSACGVAAQTPRQSADRALAYLAREVPAWKKENGCYSCHNNGDAARALMAGGRRHEIEDTLEWLAHPDRWDAQQASAAFRDTKLARVQFAFALIQAARLNLLNDTNAIQSAAQMLLRAQAEDGSWPLEQEAGIGSPATYGTPLATFAAIQVLTFAGGNDDAVARAKNWLRGSKPVATPDLTAIILTLGAEAKRHIETLLRMQTSDGGWGPYRATSAEPFDTALAILSLGPRPNTGSAVDRAIAWLVSNQLPNGGWPATTRPSGNVSYAQHISTTGWATLALLSRLEP